MKIHPNCYENDIGIITKMVKGCKNIKILSKKFDHEKISKMGITHVLSVYGTVGYEFAYKNIPVILSSTFNPYKNYKFVIKSKNRNEYTKILNNLTKVKLNINKNELYEYVYMRNFHKFNILNNYEKYQKEKLIKKNNAYCYEYFLKTKNLKVQKDIIESLEKKILLNTTGNFYN